VVVVGTKKRAAGRFREKRFFPSRPGGALSCAEARGFERQTTGTGGFPTVVRSFLI
jgi:hypothetical protein